MKITKKRLEEINEAGFLNPVLHLETIGDEIELRQLTEWALGEGRIGIIRWVLSHLMTPEKGILWAIICVRHVCKIQAWLEWADKWQSGTDRTIETAQETQDGMYELSKMCMFASTETQARSGEHAADAAISALKGARADVPVSVYMATGIASGDIDPVLSKKHEDVVSETRWQIERAYELLEV